MRSYEFIASVVHPMLIAVLTEFEQRSEDLHALIDCVARGKRRRFKNIDTVERRRG